MSVLTTVTFLPAAGALVLALLPRRLERAQRWGALLVAVGTFLASIPLYTRFDGGSADYQFEAFAPWLPGLGAAYHVGVDGISVLLVLLTTFLTPIALGSAWHAIEDRTRGAEVGCYSCMLNAARGELNLASAFGRWCLATSMVAAGDTDRAGTLMALLNEWGG